MLASIKNALQGILDFFGLLFDFVIDMFKGIADFVVNLAKVPALIASLVSDGVIPSIFVSGILGVIAIIIILRVIGRD